MASEIGFDSELYLRLQSEHIRERISHFDKLYLEFGGKLFDDFHASRVLPGFAPDNKLKMLEQLKDQAEIVLAVGADAIEQNKVRGDLGITYDVDAIRLVSVFRSRGFLVNSIVITKYNGQPAADKFRQKLDSIGVRSYLTYMIEGYPSDVAKIVSDQGFGKNDFVETTRPLVVITAPGPGSGKMATCLSQMYHEHKRGVNAGYAKFETFPIWNIPLRHPVNLAYESATADLDDLNMIDPYHLEAYGETTVNYNRDIEIFPVLAALFEAISGSCPYKSPTDMGVNMAGNAIVDDEICKRAACQEIIRRYYKTACSLKKGNADKNELLKQKILLQQAGVEPSDRKVAEEAVALQEKTGNPAAAIEIDLEEKEVIVTGRTNALLGAAASCMLNTLKVLAGIPHEEKVISEEALLPIQTLKTRYLGGHNPRLHSDEMLIALSASSSMNEHARLAMDQLPKLRGTEAHSSVILSHVDEETYRRLGIQLTCTPEYEEGKEFIV
ncbi:MAG: DUF1846 domain-containing protein [Eubacterium sp.]|nr:DUF1846 domain-containing protein [Eubacterium sp.]